MLIPPSVSFHPIKYANLVVVVVVGTAVNMSTALNVLGVKPGESWCLSGPRFVEALANAKAPNTFIHSTHQRMLELVDIETLKAYALDL